MRHHLVILRDVYLDALLAGRKRIECRLSSIRRPPFEAVEPRDLLWFKRPSRPIHAVAVAGRCAFRELNAPADLARFVEPHTARICAEEGFFRDAAQWARFATLIWIDTVVRVSPIPIRKSDQRAWVVLDQMPIPHRPIASARQRKR
ncbi:MAG: hypothetical protein ACE5E1_05030 [Phycisphaerae bacterium]